MNNSGGRLATGQVTVLLELDSEGRITLPENVRTALESGGDTLLLIQNSTGGFEIIPETRIPADQRWFYHPEMQERVRGAARTPGEAEELLKR